MKKVRKIFKNALKANEDNIKEVIARVDYRPHTENGLGDIMIPYLYSLKNIKVANFDQDIQSRAKIFNSVLDGNISKWIANNFIDRISILLAMDRVSCEHVVSMTQELNTDKMNAVLQKIETMAKDGNMTRNVLISVTNMVAETSSNTKSFVPHIQIAIYDGLLYSPSGNILYIEKIIGKTRMALIKKTPVTLKRYNYTLYEMDNNSNILRIENHENVRTDKDIFRSISRKRLFTNDELFDKLIGWFKFKPSEGVILNEDSTTKIMGQTAH